MEYKMLYFGLIMVAIAALSLLVLNPGSTVNADTGATQDAPQPASSGSCGAPSCPLGGTCTGQNSCGNPSCGVEQTGVCGCR